MAGEAARELEGRVYVGKEGGGWLEGIKVEMRGIGKKTEVEEEKRERKIDLRVRPRTSDTRFIRSSSNHLARYPPFAPAEDSAQLPLAAARQKGTRIIV